MAKINTTSPLLHQRQKNQQQLFGMAVVCIIFLTLCAACSKWLDVRPVTEVPEETMYASEQGFFEVLSGTYVQMGRPQLYGKELTFGLLDALAQRYTSGSARQTYNVIMSTPTGVYDYEAQGSRATYIDPVWQGLYRIIGNTNNLLANIDKRQAIFSENHYNNVKGQALGLRAFLHFDLLRLFAPSPQTAGEQTFIPYVRTYDPVSSPKLTVTSTIANCLQDLDEAQRLLAVDKDMRENAADRFLTFTRNRFNYYAVLGLKARIYMYNGQLDSAYSYARQVIEAVPAQFRFTTKERVVNGDRTFVSEHLFSLRIQNMRNIYNDVFANAGFIRLTVTESALQRIYEEKTADFRYIDHWRSSGAGISFMKLSQDGLADTSRFAAQMPLLRLSEVYYIAAESSTNIDSATYFLNQVRAHRGMVTGPQDELRGLNQQQLAQEVQKEYLKEFYGEGQLFYFYKRLGYPLIPGLTPDDASIPATSSVYTWPIPFAELQGR